MAMNKLKSSEPLDRLSELPDSLIFDIFAFLPMTDVVRTTFLSHRWRNLWTTAPNLNFDEHYGVDKFRFFVYGALLRWRGARIHKFKLYCPDHGNFLLADVDLWVRFAIDNGVQQFYLRCTSATTYVPQCVYYHSSLKNLCLNSCSLKIDGNVAWNHLKRLSMYHCFGVTQHVIDQIFCGSPLLEVLTLSVVIIDENSNLSFRSTSLKELSIYRNVRYDQGEHAELRIWTPNLEKLKIKGDANSKYLLENVSSLTRVTLGFHNYDWICWRDDFGLQLIGLLQSIQHAESVTLLDWCIKGIFALLDNPISPLPNVKFLELNVSFEESEDMVRLLEVFPNIKTMVLKQNKFGKKWFRGTSNLEFKADDPSRPFVRELTTVEVTWDERDLSIFPLIETLLKYASKLKKIVFRVKGFKPPSPPSNSLLLASQKLLGVQRSSRKAVFSFYEY